MLANGQVLASSEKSTEPRATLTLYEGKGAVLLGVGSLVGEAARLLESAIENRESPEGRPHITTGDFSTASGAFAVAIDGSSRDDKRYAVGHKDQMATLVRAVELDEDSLEREDWHSVGAADVTLLLFGSLTDRGPGCQGSYAARDGAGGSARVAFWRGADPVPVYRWWFGGKSKTAKVDTRSGLVVSADGPNVIVVWSAAKSSAAALIASGMSPDSAVDVAGDIQEGVASSERNACFGLST